MAVYGYHRTSTREQHLDRGIHEIKKFCGEHGMALTELYTDQQTGKNFDRPEYQFLRKRILPGDTLIISELDRLGRNKQAILEELRFFQEKQVRVMILEVPTTLTDCSSMGDGIAQLVMGAINNMLIEMFAVFAQAEIEKKEKRQKEGIAAKKARGDWDNYGRPRAMDMTAFTEAYAAVETGEITGEELRRRLGISHSTFYRYKGKLVRK